jgi:hypothetical protein
MKVRAGDPLRISADAFNSFIDAADAHRRGQMSITGARPGGPDAAGQIVTVRNTSGADQARFSVLAISGIAIAPADNLPAFQTRPVFTTSVATADSTKLVILQQPISSTRFGQALIAGMSAVRINMTDATHTYAKPTANDPTKLTSDGGSGPFRILYAESGTGTKWAVVQWPVGGGSPIVIAKFDGTRTSKRYTGHLWSGSQGAAVQWIFLNDPGVGALLSANEYVEVFAAPTWLASDASFGAVATYGEKYIARSPVWALLA